MTLPTLDQFLDSKWKYPPNSYVRCKGFRELYVRKQKLYVTLEGRSIQVDPVIQIGRIEAHRKNKGYFTNLFQGLVRLGFSVYVECVQVPRFRQKLERLGFKQVDGHGGYPSYLYIVKQRIQDAPYSQTQTGETR